MTRRPILTFSAVPTRGTDPDHHLWRNGRRWWIAFTYHTADNRKHRVRESLGTCDVAEARRRRDQRLQHFEREHGHRLSLRFAALASFELGDDAHGSAARASVDRERVRTA